MFVLRDRSFSAAHGHKHMKIDDRTLGVRNVMTYVLTHAAEEGFHKNQSAVWQHCAPTVFQDSYAVFITPVMEDESKKIEVACRDGFEEISRNNCATFRKAQRNRASLRLRDIFGPVIDDSRKLGFTCIKL